MLNAPASFYADYPLESVGAPAHREYPPNRTYLEWEDCGAVGKSYEQDVHQPVSSLAARYMRRAYYAALAYADYNVGLLLDEVAARGLEAETIVVLFSDHGYHLGEGNIWCKSTNQQVASRVPLIIKVPWLSD